MEDLSELLEVFFKKNYDHFDQVFSKIKYQDSMENKYFLMKDEESQSLLGYTFKEKKMKKFFVQIVPCTPDSELKNTILKESIPFNKKLLFLKHYQINSESNNNLLLINLFYGKYFSLEQLFKKNIMISFSQFENILKQILEGYFCLYVRNMIHRNLGPHSIFLKLVKINESFEIKVKLGSLKLLRITNLLDSQIQFSREFSQNIYNAPELQTQKQTDSRCDIYSIGQIIQQMLTKFKLRNKISQQEQQLFDKMIAFHVLERPKWEKIFEYFKINQNNDLDYDCDEKYYQEAALNEQINQEYKKNCLKYQLLQLILYQFKTWSSEISKIVNPQDKDHKIAFEYFEINFCIYYYLMLLNNNRKNYNYSEKENEKTITLYKLTQASFKLSQQKFPQKISGINETNLEKF